MGAIDFLTLDFIYGFLTVIPYILGLFGVIFFFGGYRLIRPLYLILGVVSGFVLGYFVGFTINSLSVALTIGLIFSVVFGFFSYVHYDYLKGVSLGILSFFTALIYFLNFTGFGYVTVVLIISLIIALCLAVLVYPREVMVTTIVTALLGGVAFTNVFLDMDATPLTSVIALLIGCVGIWIQLFVTERLLKRIRR